MVSKKQTGLVFSQLPKLPIGARRLPKLRGVVTIGNIGRVSIYWLLVLVINHDTDKKVTASEPGLDALEEQIWLAESDTLSSLESKAVRRVQEEPKSTHAHYLVGLIYLRHFKYDPRRMDYLRKASQLGQQAIDLDENSEFGYLLSASILDLMGYTDNALEMLQVGTSASVIRSWRRDFAGSIFSRKSRNHAPLALAQAALELEPQAKLVVSPFIVAMLKASTRAGSDRNRPMEESFDSPFFKQSLALAYAQDEQYEAAKELFDEVMSSDNEATLDAQINRAIVSLAEDKNTELSRDLLHASLRNEALVDPEKRSLIQAHLGKLYLHDNQVDRAKKLFNFAISKSQNSLHELNLLTVYTELSDSKSLCPSDTLKSSLHGVAIVHAIQVEILSNNICSQDKAIRAY